MQLSEKRQLSFAVASPDCRTVYYSIYDGVPSNFFTVNVHFQTVFHCVVGNHSLGISCLRTIGKLQLKQHDLKVAHQFRVGKRTD